LDIKNYILKWYGIDLTESEENDLLDYLIENSSDIYDQDDLKKFIKLFIYEEHKNERLRVLKEADNSDLRQALKLIKVKSGK